MTDFATAPEPEWFADSACIGTADPTIWFTPSRAVTAKAVCSTCDVRGACLEYAVDHNITDGIWGGYDPAERARLFPRPGRRR